MAIRIPPLPQGTRVRVARAGLPQDPAVLGRTGVVLSTTEYRDNAVGVVLDGEHRIRFFTPSELEVVTQDALPPERRQAKLRPALP